MWSARAEVELDGSLATSLAQAASLCVWRATKTSQLSEPSEAPVRDASTFISAFNKSASAASRREEPHDAIASANKLSIGWLTDWLASFCGDGAQKQFVI